jgi:hypothetical protein
MTGIGASEKNMPFGGSPGAVNHSANEPSLA